MPGEVLWGNRPLGGVVQEAILRDAGIVDEDVDLKFTICGGKVLFRRVDDLGGCLVWMAEVGLNGDAADGVLRGQRVAKGFGAGARRFRGEIEQQRAAFGCQIAGDCLADP